MAAEIFTALSNLRMILDTETDADSPITETLKDAIRYAIECMLMLSFSTGDDGSATSDPPDDTTGVLTDTGAAYDADEHNQRTLLMTSGAAKGNFYTIDDTTATTLVCSGDNLYADGVRSGDTYIVLYDIKGASGSIHDHDALNSPRVVLADAQVTQAKLKTSSGSVSVGGGSSANLTLPGGSYGFSAQFYEVSATSMDAYHCVGGNMSGGWTTNIFLDGLGVGQTVYAQQRYVTSSGELHWLFVLVERGTGKRLCMFEAPDHPCFGNRGAKHPFPNYDPAIHEIIAVNPSLEMVRAIELGRFEPDYFLPEKTFLEKFDELYEIEEAKQADWPDIPVTVALPRVHNGEIVDDWRFMPRGTLLTPVKRVIPRPEYITPLAIRPRRAL